MRKVRILFTGVNDFPTFLQVLECLNRVGVPQYHQFDYQGAGHGFVDLCTKYNNKLLEQSLAAQLPGMITGTENITENGHDCHAA